jgi:hypothetical protein
MSYEYYVQRKSGIDRLESEEAWLERMEDMRQWCYDRFEKWGRSQEIFWFQKEEDYAMFMLRWA